MLAHGFPKAEARNHASSRRALPDSSDRAANVAMLVDAVDGISSSIVLCDLPTVDMYKDSGIYAILDEGCNSHGPGVRRLNLLL